MLRVDLHPGVCDTFMIWSPELLTEKLSSSFVFNACGLAQQMDRPSIYYNALRPGTKVTESEKLIVASELSGASYKDVL